RLDDPLGVAGNARRQTAGMARQAIALGENKAAVERRRFAIAGQLAEVLLKGGALERRERVSGPPSRAVGPIEATAPPIRVRIEPRQKLGFLLAARRQCVASRATIALQHLLSGLFGRLRIPSSRRQVPLGCKIR